MLNKQQKLTGSGYYDFLCMSLFARFALYLQNKPNITLNYLALIITAHILSNKI